MSSALCEATPRSVTDLKKDVFDALFEAHYVDVLRFVERRIDDRHAAEDLVAEVFEVLWTKLDPAEPVGAAWLYRTAALVIANHYRRRDRRRLAEQSLMAMLSDGAGLGIDDRLTVRAALRRLGDRERQIVLLTYWDGLSGEEIGAVMGMSTSAVWATLSRTRTKLRGLMDGGEEDS